MQVGRITALFDQSRCQIVMRSQLGFERAHHLPTGVRMAQPFEQGSRHAVAAQIGRKRGAGDAACEQPLRLRAPRLLPGHPRGPIAPDTARRQADRRQPLLGVVGPQPQAMLGA